MKRMTMILGAAAGVAVLWSAGWFAGKTLYVAPKADRAIERLRGGDLFFSYDSRAIGGFPFGYDVEYRAAELSGASGFWRWSAPSISVGSGVADGGALAFTPAPESKLVVDAGAFGGGAEAPPAVFDIVARNMRVTIAGTEGVVAQEGAAPGFTVDLTADAATAEQVAGGGALSDGLLRFEGLAANGVFGEESAAGALVADLMETGYRFSADGVSEVFSSGVTEGVDLSFNGTALDSEGIAEFLERGGVAELRFVADGYSMSGGSTGGPSRPPYTMEISGGRSEGVVAFGEGRARYSADVETMRYEMEMDEPAPVAGGGALGRLGVTLEMPLERTSTPEPYALSLAIDELEVDEGLWALVDPASGLKHGPMSVDLELGGVVRLLVDLGVGAAAGQSPVDVESVEIRSAALEGLGVRARATGTLDIAGDAATPDGEINLDVTGVLGLIDDLARAGLVPRQQAEVYKMIALQVGRAGDGGPDHLIADVEMRDGAMIVNGQRLR